MQRCSARHASQPPGTPSEAPVSAQERTHRVPRAACAAIFAVQTPPRHAGGSAPPLQQRLQLGRLAALRDGADGALKLQLLQRLVYERGRVRVSAVAVAVAMSVAVMVIVRLHARRCRRAPR